MNHYIETPAVRAYNLQSWNEIENEATYVTNTGYLEYGNLQAGSGIVNCIDDIRYGKHKLGLNLLLVSTE